MVEGGILIVDNVISHAEELKGFIEAADKDERVDTIIVPYKNGELLCRKK
jgi:predicted O-methyltransferase YrrM